MYRYIYIHFYQYETWFSTAKLTLFCDTCERMIFSNRYDHHNHELSQKDRDLRGPKGLFDNPIIKANILSDNFFEIPQV